jgi:hypothetical protein
VKIDKLLHEIRWCKRDHPYKRKKKRVPLKERVGKWLRSNDKKKTSIKK